MAVRVNGDEATCFNPYFNGSSTSTKELEKDIDIHTEFQSLF